MPRANTARWVALTVGLALTGCDEDVERREWRPEDHAQPTQPDPERTPAEAGAPPSAETIARAAAAVFQSACASCHGVDGRGGSAAPPGTRDLSDPAWQEATSDEAIAAVIVQGRGMMPAFGGRLPREAIVALVQHVRTLGAGGAPAMDAPGPEEGAAVEGAPTPAGDEAPSVDAPAPEEGAPTPAPSEASP